MIIILTTEQGSIHHNNITLTSEKNIPFKMSVTYSSVVRMRAVEDHAPFDAALVVGSLDFSASKATLERLP